MPGNMSDSGSQKFYLENDFWSHVQRTQLEQKNKKLWEEIRKAAKTNVALAAEFERLKVIYFLSKGAEDGE